MNSIYDKLMKCYDCFQKKINFTPEIALVLGSGLGNYASKIKIEATLDYHSYQENELQARQYLVRSVGKGQSWRSDPGSA